MQHSSSAAFVPWCAGVTAGIRSSPWYVWCWAASVHVVVSSLNWECPAVLLCSTPSTCADVHSTAWCVYLLGRACLPATACVLRCFGCVMRRAGGQVGSMRAATQGKLPTSCLAQPHGASQLHNWRTIGGLLLQGTPLRWTAWWTTTQGSLAAGRLAGMRVHAPGTHSALQGGRA